MTNPPRTNPSNHDEFASPLGETMTTTHSTPSAQTGARAQGGPPLWVLARAYTTLMLADVAVSATIPQPSASAETVLAYQRSHIGAMQLAAFFQFGSAMPLAIWAA